MMAVVQVVPQQQQDADGVRYVADRWSIAMRMRTTTAAGRADSFVSDEVQIEELTGRIWVCRGFRRNGKGIDSDGGPGETGEPEKEDIYSSNGRPRR